MSSQVAASFALAVLGGFGANVGLMQLNAMHKGCANVCTLCQLCFGVSDTLSTSSRRRFLSSGNRKLGLPIHVVFASMFFLGPFLGNLSISITEKDFYPVFLVVRSCGCVASMLLGWLFAHKQYSRGQVLAVIAITLGAALTTFGCFVAKNAVKEADGAAETTSSALFLAGVGLLVCNLVNDAGLGVLQAAIFEQQGKAVEETMAMMSLIGTGLMMCVAGSHAGTSLYAWTTNPTLAYGFVPLEWAFLACNFCGNWNSKKLQTWLNANSTAVVSSIVPLLYRLMASVLAAVVLTTDQVLPLYTWLGIMLVSVGSAAYLLSASQQNKEEASSKER
jgi:UDP-xylose/UDP-N-acetylglucosamine transporter B4